MVLIIKIKRDGMDIHRTAKSLGKFGSWRIQVVRKVHLGGLWQSRWQATHRQITSGKGHTRGTWKCRIIRSDLVCSTLVPATDYKAIIVPVCTCEWDQMFVYGRHTIDSFLHMCSRTGTTSSRPYPALCPVGRDRFAHFNASYRTFNSFFVMSSWKFRSFFWLDMLIGQILIF